MNTEPQVEAVAAASPTQSGAAPEPESAVATPTESRPLRRDAERNRRLILSAAKVVFAQRGLDVSLDEVAKEAGLGVGTVYRRFPNRDALIGALFDDMVVSIKRVADEALALPRAWDGLVHFMTDMLATQAHDKGLRDTMIAQEMHLGEHDPQKGQAVREIVQPMLYALVDRAQQEGDLRADVAPTDIAVMLITAVSMLELTAPVSPDNWRRHLSVMIDGLRARPAGANSVLVEPPLDEDQIEACMAGWKYSTRQPPRQRTQPS
ncbi:MAG TPA: helix-turn-helix domain-containing protein [Actinocrinis sp.]|nr:helix-turn-helix domain-containing protein [Actinocrinis sp.]